MVYKKKTNFTTIEAKGLEEKNIRGGLNKVATVCESVANMPMSLI